MSGKGAKGLSGSGKGAKGTMGDKKKPVSRSARAGLQFPVGRIHRLLKVGEPAAGVKSRRVRVLVLLLWAGWRSNLKLRQSWTWTCQAHQLRMP